ncbi:DUF5133 domain-containing protein [Streptomyces phytohabitans]|uniref:DUF5133 domain-containing protein n=1 Tax=Streptomyces phytohabitans TaxID=1150371 RepID=UPI00345C4540
MMLAHPAVLRDLLTRYDALHALHAERGDEDARQRLADVSYTLCVSTGTRDIETALHHARRQLARVEADRGPTS